MLEKINKKFQEKRIVTIAMTQKFHNKPYLSYDIDYDFYILIMNPKTHYKKIKEIMNSIKRYIKGKEGVNVNFVFKNYNNLEGTD